MLASLALASKLFRVVSCVSFRLVMACITLALKRGMKVLVDVGFAACHTALGLLAGRTKIRGALALHNTFNDGGTDAAGLTRALVHGRM